MLTFKQKVIHVIIFAGLFSIPVIGVCTDAKEINAKKLEKQQQIESNYSYLEPTKNYTDENENTILRNYFDLLNRLTINRELRETRKGQDPGNRRAD